MSQINEGRHYFDFKLNNSNTISRVAFSNLTTHGNEVYSASVIKPYRDELTAAGTRHRSTLIL